MISSWLGLEGRRVLVAGGAGSLGSAIAGAFREHGADVAVIDAQPGDHIQADLRDPEAARGAMRQAAEQLGGIGVVVQSGGINRRQPIEGYSDVDWQDV